MADPGASPGRGERGGDGSRGDGSTTRSPAKSTCTHMGEPIECTSSWGSWDQGLECWVKALSPQPAPSDPPWQGRTEGAIYWCQPPGVGVGGGHAFWAPDGPDAPGGIDPIVLAERAIDSMNLHAITIGITPPPTAGAQTLVGIPTWMWIDDPSDNTRGPITRSASVGWVTVTATGTVTKVVWDMGDGASVTCVQGTAYRVSYDDAWTVQRLRPRAGKSLSQPTRYRVPPSR